MWRFLASRRLVVLGGCSVAIVVTIGTTALIATSWYDAVQSDKFAKLSSPLVDELAKKLDVSYVEAARVFVFKNTDHDMESDWYHAHAEDLPYVLEQLYKTAIGDADSERPDLACGWRVKAMQSLLDAKEIKSDTIYLYNDTGSDPNQGSHVVIEADNPETGRLEVHDVDFNVKYLRRDGATASLHDLMTEDVPTSFDICDEEGCFSERVMKTTVAQNDYYKGVYYRDRDVFVLNRAKFDVDKTFIIHRIRGDEIMDVYDYFNYIYPDAPIVEF